MALNLTTVFCFKCVQHAAQGSKTTGCVQLQYSTSYRLKNISFEILNRAAETA